MWMFFTTVVLAPAAIFADDVTLEPTMAGYAGLSGAAAAAKLEVIVPSVSPPVQYGILNCNPVFEGPAKNSWGDIVGYLDDGNPPGAVTFTVNAAEAGTYKCLYTMFLGADLINIQLMTARQLFITILLQTLHGRFLHFQRI